MIKKRVPTIRTVTVEHEGEEAEIRYSLPAALRSNVKLQAAFAGDDPIAKEEALYIFLAESIEKWEAVDEEGKRVPIRAEVIAQLGDEVVLKLMAAIGGDIRRVAETARQEEGRPLQQRMYRRIELKNHFSFLVAVVALLVTTA